MNHNKNIPLHILPIHIHQLIRVIRIALCLIPLWTLTSCYEDIDLDKYRESNGENLLVVNSFVNPDSTVSVMATRTYFFSDIHKERSYVRDLEMYLSLNGTKTSKMLYDPQKGMYTSEIKPKSGDKVSISTTYCKVEVSAEDVIPEKVRIESVTASRQGPLSIYSDRDYVLTYKITFTDPVGKDNYYFLQYDKADWHKGFNMGERDFTAEYVFQQLARRINTNIPGWEPYSPFGLPFSDYGIDGKTHTLVVKETVQGASGVDLTKYTQMQRVFKLYSISHDYYEYLVSVIYNNPDSDGLHGGMIDLGVTEPVKYFSNINGGVGIFGAYVLDDAKLDVMSIVGRFPK